MVQRRTEQPGPSRGNGVIVALVDSRQGEFSIVRQTILCALGHFRIPYRILDIAGEAVSAAALLNAPAIVIGQENFGLGASAKDMAEIVSAVSEGTGLINFDAHLERYDKAFTEALGLNPKAGFESFGVHEVGVPDVSHYITYTQKPGSKYTTRIPVPGIRPVSEAKGWQCLARSDDGPALIAGRIKSGRVVQWLVSPQIWTLQFFGHAHGLDDLFWKGIVWAARKPFAMMPIPPFVRFRLDDCNGLYRNADDLKFLDVFNRFGHKPNVSVCLSALKDDGWAKLKELQDAGKVEVAPHVLKPGVSLFYGDQAGEYSEERLRDLMTETKRLFDSQGVQPSKILSDHVHEYSERVLPYLADLGIEFKMNVTAPSESWSGQHLDWAPAPYGSMSYAIDYIPGPYPLFVVFNHYPTFDFVRINAGENQWIVNRGGGVGPYKWDFLNGLTKATLGRNDVESMANRLADHTRLGLNSLFFGGSISHSHFTSELSLGEWEAVLTRYEELTMRLPKLNVGYDDMALYVRSRHHTFIDQVNIGAASGSSRIRLKGEADNPLKLSIFKGNDEAIDEVRVDVPVFTGSHEVTF